MSIREKTKSTGKHYEKKHGEKNNGELFTWGNQEEFLHHQLLKHSEFKLIDSFANCQKIILTYQHLKMKKISPINYPHPYKALIFK